MKKSIVQRTAVVLSLLLFAFVGTVSAQRNEITIESFSWGVRLVEGVNTLPVPGGRGTIRLVKRVDTFSNVMYQDVAGKIERLTPGDGGVEGAPTPACKCPLPDACFATADKNIGMCMCKPCDLSNGDTPYYIGLLLPAVQKVREAAARM